jgi:tetratricopeptide (TPR) repeat protein
VITGEAGIGKSHLLGCIAARMKAAGGSAWHARAFEPETGRPYGIWFDLLRSMNADRPGDGRADPLAALLPEADPAALPGDRDRLFEAIHGLLRQAVAERPAAILLDDIQWMDGTSCALLHYIARGADTSELLLVCAAREGEIDDNAAATAVLRSLARDGRIRAIGLGRLDAADTDALIRAVDPALEGTSIFVQSGGNPLYALELARAHRRGDSRPGITMAAVVDGQIARLSERARETLLWAAVIGRAFTPDDLGRAAHMDAHDLFATLGELERRGLLRPAGDEIYDFAHDVVRQMAYRSLSQPRRRLLHRCIMRAIQAGGANDAAMAADMAYHAALADEHETAARACANAGARALRLFASTEAGSFADRGLRHVDRTADAAAMVELRVELMRIRILAAAGPGMRPLPRLADALACAAAAAESAGLAAPAATAHYLLSVLHQEAGDTRQAQTSTLRAAAVGRAADEATRAHQLANTARCLLELETEIARSRELIREADGIAGSTGMDVCELHWARGLLHRWDGEFEEAVNALARALALARRGQDRWREYKCLTWLAMLQQEMGQYADMRAHCAELRTVAKRLDEDETPFVAALQALALLGIGDPGADDVLADALGRLRVIDDKSHLAYVLNSAACQHIKVGRFDQVRLCACEALTAAVAMHRQSEVAIARTLLAKVGTAGEVGTTEIAAENPDDLNARARLVLRECLSRPPGSNGHFNGELPS